MKTYGRVKFVEKDRHGRPCWLIECEPHVSMRLKRWFGQLSTQSFGEHTFTATADTARDLECFIERFPLRMDPKTERRLREDANAHRERQSIAHKLLSGRKRPKAVKLALALRDYQLVAVQMTREMEGLLVGDDVGLGKTAIAIGLSSYEDARPALIVTLTHLPTQWKDEFAKFAPDLKVHILKKGQPYDITKGPRGKNVGMPDIIVSNYHKLSGWAETLRPLVKTVVFDECQELRIPRSQKYAAAKYVRTDCTYAQGLSATPIYNMGSEAHSVLDVLRPGAMGTREEFVREWCSLGSRVDREIIVDPRAFGEYLRDTSLMIRRTRSDVGRELPALTRVPHHVDANIGALEDVSAACRELALYILGQGRKPEHLLRPDALVNPDSLPKRDASHFLASKELSWRLRQATGIAKAKFVADFVRVLADQGERVVLYGWHHEVYRIWCDRLADLKPVLFTGEESPREKEASKQAFLDPDGSKVLIMSLRAGAGLDGLQSMCRTIVFGELDWSYGVHEQCLSEDTEVLTPDGFKGRDQVHVGDTLAGFDMKDGSIRWVRATRKTDRELAVGEAMFGMVGVRTRKIDPRVTAQHAMIVRRGRRLMSGKGRSCWERVTAERVAGQARRFVPRCGMQASSGVPLTDQELRFLGLFLSDGSTNRRSVTIYQAAKQPWNADIAEILDGCGFRWKRYKRRGKRGTIYIYAVERGLRPRWQRHEVVMMRTMFAIGRTDESVAAALGRTATAIAKKRRKLQRTGARSAGSFDKSGRGWLSLREYLDKDLSPLLEEVTREQLLHLLFGLNLGDGSKAKSLKTTMRITSTNKRMLDRLQSLCVRRGLSANISERKSKTKAGKRAFDIYISRASVEAWLPHSERCAKFAAVPHVAGERVWCLSNELGTLVTRRRGKVVIVGNCEGRIQRDGQKDKVVAYYLTAQVGSDPVVLDALGIKRNQLEGIRDPRGSLVERLQTDPERIRRLATDYLKQDVGLAVSDREPPPPKRVVALDNAVAFDDLADVAPYD